jgi:hypothetical protein
MIAAKWWKLGAALAVAAGSAALVFSGDETADTVAAAPRANAAARKNTPAAVEPPHFVEPQRDMLAKADVDLFAVKSFLPPPPPPPPPPKPTAPPLPFKFLGRASGEGAETLFLAVGTRNLVVHPGDVVEGNYRLDEIAGGNAVFTYQPLQERQMLPLER